MKQLWAWILSMFGGKNDRPVKPIVVEPDKPTTGQSTDAVFPTSKLHTCPDVVRSWPVVSKLTARRAGGRLYFNVGNPALWPNVGGTCGHIHCELYRDGAWHAGPCDALRPPNASGDCPVKEDNCACVPNGKKRLYEPKDGEEVRFVISGFCRNGVDMKPAQRTSEAVITW
jgi:hypothetical protein